MSGGIDLGTIRASITWDDSGLVSGVKHSERVLQDFGTTVKTRTSQLARTIGRDMTLAGAGIAGGLGLAIKKAAEFDQSMRNTNSLLKLSEQGFQDLKKGVMSVVDDPKIRQGPVDLAKAMYDVASSGFQGKQALDILRQSAYGASAGMTDTATSSRVLMAVLNSGIGGVNNAREAMDVLFREVDLGVNTFEGLAGALGDVLPTAKVAGVSLQEVSAALAVMTRRGININEAVTALNQLLNHIIKPGKDSAKVMEALGIQNGATALQTKGLTGVLEQMRQKTHGNVDAIVKLVPEIRGMKALLTLVDQGGQQYTDMLKGMATATDGAGATQRALTEQNKGATAQYELLKKEVEQLGISIGTNLLPAFRDMIGYAKQAVEWFGKLPDGVKSAGAEIAAFGAIALVTGGQVLTLITRLKELGLITASGRTLLGGGGVLTLAALDAYLIHKGLSEGNPEDRSKYLMDKERKDYLDRARSMGPSALAEAQRHLAEQDTEVKRSKNESYYDAMERDRHSGLLRTAPVINVRPLGGGPPNPLDAITARDTAKDAKEKAQEAERNRRTAEIALLALQEGALAKRKAAEKKADDEYITSINDGTRTQTEAFKIRKAEYAKAMREYLAAVEEFKKKQAETIAARQNGPSLIEANRKEIEDAIRLNAGEMLSDSVRAAADGLRESVEQLHEVEAKRQADFIEAAQRDLDYYRQLTEAVKDYIKASKETEKTGGTGDVPDSKPKKAKAQIDTIKQMMKDLQRSAADILANLFEDVLSGHKNPFASFLNAFKQMLIRMAAEWAASEVVRMIAGLFNRKGGGVPGAGGDEGTTGKTSGTIAGLASMIPGIGGVVGAGIGALGKIFHFAEGGWVPGPVGAPRAAVVHGGEFVVSRAMQQAGSVMPTGVDGPVRGGMVFHGDIHMHGVQDIAGLSRELGRYARRQGPMRGVA